MQTDLLPSKVEVSLLKAGWTPGRRAELLVSKWEIQFFQKGEFVLSPVAREVLLELGGLRFQQDGPGEEVALGSFYFDPTVAEGESDRFANFESTIGARLCPVGEAHDRYTYMAVAEDGRVMCLMDDGWIIGKNIEEALSSLILGRIGEPVYT